MPFPFRSAWRVGAMVGCWRFDPYWSMVRGAQFMVTSVLVVWAICVVKFGLSVE
jgi:hypothetical protein